MGIQKFVDTRKIDTQNLGALYFVGTQNLWVLKVCDDTKVHVGGKENQNICVNRKTYALFPYMLLPYMQKHTI